MGGVHIASALFVRPICPVRKSRPVNTKMVSGQYLLNTFVYWIHISCKIIYNHEIHVKFN